MTNAERRIVAHTPVMHFSKASREQARATFRPFARPERPDTDEYPIGHFNTDDDSSLSAPPIPFNPYRRFDPADPLGHKHNLTMVQQLFRTVYEQESLTLEDVHPHVIRCAWRFVRSLCSYLNIVSRDEFLQEALKPNGHREDPWVLRRKIDFQSFQRLPPQLAGALEAHDSITLMPPMVAEEDCIPETAQPLDGYDPEQDYELLRYQEVMKAIDRAVNLRSGTQLDSEAGNRAVEVLRNPQTIRLAFPSRSEIINYEMILVERAMDKLIIKGQLAAAKWLRKSEGMSIQEAHQILALAGQMALAMGESDIEQQRAVMNLRIEDYLTRCKEALDLRGELNGLKHQSIIQGLARSEGADDMGNFVAVIRDAAANINDRKMAAVPERVMALLPPAPEPITVPVVSHSIPVEQLRATG